MSSGSDGIEPSSKYKNLLGTRFKHKSEYYDYGADDPVYCDVCGKIFETSGARNFHKSAVHDFHSAVIDPRKQWDFGQLDLRTGVNALWNDFMHEHDLPKVVFLYDWNFIQYVAKSGKVKQLQGYSYMPRFYQDKVVDLETGMWHHAIVFPREWFLLDPDAKAASLAHTAVHIDNWRHDIWGLTFNKQHRHTRVFRDTALTYDLFVANVPIRGFAMTHITDKFRRKHRYAMKLISRYHQLAIKHGKKAFQCQLGGYERDNEYDYYAEWTNFETY